MVVDPIDIFNKKIFEEYNQTIALIKALGIGTGLLLLMDPLEKLLEIAKDKKIMRR